MLNLKKYMLASCHSGFTIIEIVMVCVIIGILAVIGLPLYNKTYLTTIEVEAAAQLETLWHAQQMYYARHRYYWPAENPNAGNYAPGIYTLSEINSDLNLSIIPAQAELRCHSIANGNEETYFECGVILNNDTVDTIKLTEKPLDHTPSSADPNPCCVISGNCQQVQDCI